MKSVINFFKVRESNVEAVVFQLLKNLKVPVPKKVISNTLFSHPDFPSILSISDSLHEWDIKNTTYLIDKESYSSEEMLTPFIAHTNEGKGKVMLVKKIEKDQVFCIDENGNTSMSESEFLTIWDGVALHAEKSEEKSKLDYKQNIVDEIIKKSRLTLLGTIFLVAVYFSVIGLSINSTLYYLSLLLTSVGSLLTIFMLSSVLKTENSFINKICGLTKKSDCNSLLNSDAAKITSWLSWSEVGFTYFIGSLLGLLLFPNISLNVFFALNLMALPFTIYSISYQAYKKSWCLLCVSVQVILWLSIITYFTTDFEFKKPEIIDIVKCLFCFMIPIIGWIFLKPILTDFIQIKHLKKSLNYFKYDSNTFFLKLKNGIQHALPEYEHTLEFGNLDSKNIITIVSNPYCGPCTFAHHKLDQFLKYKNDVKVQVILLASKNTNDSSQQVTKHIYSLNIKDKKLGIESLNYWFSLKIKGYDFLSNQFPISTNPLAESLLEKGMSWCDEANVQYTPTLFLNGYKLPNGYNVEDLKYFLD